MPTPEELKAIFAQEEAKSQELREKIVRAQNWSQLFSNPKAAQVDFKTNLVDAHRFYYKKDDHNVVYTVEPNPDGDIHRVSNSPGYDSTYQRLSNGDIRITHYFPDKPADIDLITPDIGNIDHPYTNQDLVRIDEDALMGLKCDVMTFSRLTVLSSYLRGKPATHGWEDTMLRIGFLPQRIGHRLFPHSSLEELNQLRKQYPQLIAKS